MVINTYNWSDPGTKERVVECLMNKQVVLSSTDTVPGLMAIPSSKTFSLLSGIKVRHEKPYLLLIGNKAQLIDFVQLPNDPRVAKLIDQCWPGPLTLIFKARAGIAPCLVSPYGTVAVRMPLHQGLLGVLSEVGVLFSTSANKSGVSVPGTVDEVSQEIKMQVASIVNDGHGAGSSLPSTILNCTTTPIALVREGAYSIRKIEQIYGGTLSK